MSAEDQRNMEAAWEAREEARATEPPRWRCERCRTWSAPCAACMAKGYAVADKGDGRMRTVGEVYRVGEWQRGPEEANTLKMPNDVLLDKPPHEVMRWIKPDYRCELWTGERWIDLERDLLSKLGAVMEDG